MEYRFKQRWYDIKMNAKIKCVDSSAQIIREDKSFNGKNFADLVAVRNGYDFCQVIVSAEKDISVTVSVSELVNEAGIVFPKERVCLYYEKYILVDRNWHKNGMATGHYADAIVPVTAPKLNNVNKIAAGDNGAVVIDVSIPEEQAEGTYRGKLIFGGDINDEIDLSITVLPVSVCKANTSKCLFPINREFMEHFEGSNDADMCKAYNKVFERNRTSTSLILYGTDINEWTESAYEYLENGFNSYSIPETEIKTENGGRYIDKEDLKKRLVSLGKYCLKKVKNVFPRTFFYDWIIDEPFLAKIPDGQVANHQKWYHEAVTEAASELAEDKSFDCELGKEIIESVKQVPEVVTDFYDRLNPEQNVLHNEDGSLFHYDLSKVSLCPQFDGYDDAHRSLYDEQKEKWWYGCNSPNAPFPGYHIDDAGFSARIIGWMMAEYDITGNLYWMANFSQECNTTGSMLYVEDPYETSHRGLGSTGEGCLVYPGAAFGIKGPLETLRLKRIRQGNEEYEIIRDLITAYAKKGIDAKAAVRRVIAEARHGTRLEYEIADFERMRRTVLNLRVASSRYGFTVNVKDGENGFNYIFAADKDFTLKLNGKPCEKETFIEKRYGYAQITACFGKEEYELYFYTGNGAKIILHEELYNRNAFTGDIEELTINYHPIYREVKIKPSKENFAINIETGLDLAKYYKLGFLVNARKESPYKILSNNKVLKQGSLRWGWNRIDVDGKYSGSVITVNVADKEEIGFGEIYLTD